MSRPYRGINVPAMLSLIIILAIIVRELDVKVCNVVASVSVATMSVCEYF